MSEDRELNADLMKELHEYSLHADTNTIYLEDGTEDNQVSSVMAMRFRKNLAIITEAIAANADDPNQTVTVEINTPGGDVIPGMSIYDAIKRSKVKLIGLVTGEASSMGSVILQAFKDRVLEPNAIVMYHAGDSWLSKPSQELKAAALHDVAYNERIDDLVYARVKERQPNLTRDQFDVAVMRGLYFHRPEDAIAYGLADRIAT